MNINKLDIKDIRLAFELKGECPTIVVSAFTNDNKIYVLGSYQLENGAVSIKGLIENNDYDNKLNCNKKRRFEYEI